jgi:hypothetical protein
MLKDHLPGHVAQTAATRAFNAVLQYAFGKRGRPKFRGRDRYNSFESKEARSTIIWRDGAIQAAKAWTGAEAFLRVASNGFEPASGMGFAFPHVTLGVRAGRSKKYHANHREAGDDVGLAVLPVSRASESREAPRGSLWPSG